VSIGFLVTTLRGVADRPIILEPGQSASVIKAGS
jgi:hypothetical protein